jgi:protein TonB
MEPKKNPNKDVHRYTKQFFLIGFAISVAVVIVAFEWQSRVAQKADRALVTPPELTFYPYEVIQVKHEEPSVIKPKKIKVIDPTRIDVAKETDPEPTDIEIAFEPIEVLTPGDIQIEIPIETSPDTFIVVQQMPQPVGGYEAFYKHVSTSIKYPSRAKQRNAHGKVFVEFVVNPSGEPVNFKIVKGIGSGCDEEAVRVLKQVRWEPGKQRGNPVFVKMTVPVHFRLN